MCTDPLNPACVISSVAGQAVSDGLDGLAKAIQEGVTQVMGSLGTLWVQVGSPVLLGDGTSSSGLGTGHTGSADNLGSLLSWVMWIAGVLAVIGLIIAGVKVAIARPSTIRAAASEVGWTLVAVTITSGATALVAALYGAFGESKGSPAVALVQNSLAWYAAAIAILGLVFGAARLAWTRRGDEATKLASAVLTMVAINAFGLIAVNVLMAVSDGYATYVLSQAFKCDVGADSTCFGRNMAVIVALGTSSPIGTILVIILGLFAILASLIQIVLMVIRGGMTVILTAALPITGAAAGTSIGRQTLTKTIGWLLAAILYKPAAAIVYAVAIMLTGASTSTDSNGILTVVTGLTMMLVALVALPALMSLVTPAVGAISSGSGAGMMLAAGAGALPMGAMQLANSGTSGSSGSQGGTGPSGPSGATTTPSEASSGPAASAGPSGASASTAAGASSSGAAAGAGAGAGAGGAAAAGAGPAGAAIAGIQAVQGVHQSAVNEINSTAGGGPNGSRAV